MQKQGSELHYNFYQIGLNYQKADENTRGLFSLDDSSQKLLLKKALEEGIDGLLVISTCNRTELYGFAKHPYQLIKLLCDHTKGTLSNFENVSYVYKNSEAIKNLFHVGGGLQSQILGDFEIISQIRHSAIRSKEAGLLNSFLERLINAVIQASKRVKNETELSSGATSVAFASVHYIFNSIENVDDKNILLFGTGKIGRNTCENLVKHSNNHITLINRTREKAEKIAGKFNLSVKDFLELETEVKKSDILIVATGAQNPTITKSMIPKDKAMLILDLSIPKNVSNDILELENVNLISIDELSKMTDQTLQKRQAQIPAAHQIIDEVYQEFTQWIENRKFVPTLHALKNKLETLKNNEIIAAKKSLNGSFSEQQAELIGNKIIQKITNQLAHHLKKEVHNSKENIEVIKRMFQLEDSNSNV